MKKFWSIFLAKNCQIFFGKKNIKFFLAAHKIFIFHFIKKMKKAVGVI